MNQQKENHRIRTDSSLSHCGRGAKMRFTGSKPSLYILLLFSCIITEKQFSQINTMIKQRK